jgi:hypothetical protein
MVIIMAEGEEEEETVRVKATTEVMAEAATVHLLMDKTTRHLRQELQTQEVVGAVDILNLYQVTEAVESLYSVF